jgi:ribulose-bisphosphate carboxylase small chain
MPFQSTTGDYQTKVTLETFGFLPPMSQQEIYDQIAYIIAQGWTPAIEHVHPKPRWTTTGPCGSCRSSARGPRQRRRRAGGLPSVLSGSSRALTGYDNYTQSQGSCFVVFQGRA